MIVNDLNGINKEGLNWTKLTKIGTYLSTKTKFDKNWDQKCILTYKICESTIGSIKNIH